MGVFDAKMWMMGLALDVGIVKRETFQKDEVKRVAVFSDSNVAI
jgi:hypothetical protein